MEKITLCELNKKYRSYPVYVRNYEIDGKKYTVHSHLVGSKDIDDVIEKIAFRHASDEMITVA